MLPVYLRTAPIAPGVSNPSEFIDALFAPVVSGVILSRYDLGRCATANKLTVRMADRRHTMKIMMSENTRGVCTWLEQEIQRQADNVAALPDVLAPVREHWVSRARTVTARVQEFRDRYSRPGEAVKLHE